MTHATLPTETVAFLSMDIEGSTRLLREIGEEYAGGTGTAAATRRNCPSRAR